MHPVSLHKDQTTQMPWNKAEYDKTCLDDLSPVPSFGLIPQFQ